MRIGVTGARGFLGWHLRCRALVSEHETVPVHVRHDTDPALLAEEMAGLDAIVHLAGVNRASDVELANGNVGPAHVLANALRAMGRPIPVVFANSAHIERGGAFAAAKAESAEVLASAMVDLDAPLYDLVLPHVYGEFGKADYNSAVHTFASRLAAGISPELHDGATDLELMHAQDVGIAMLDALAGHGVDPGRSRIEGERIAVSEVIDRMTALALPYVERGSIPVVDCEMDLGLFNTIRSNLYPGGYPLKFTVHGDDRGGFYEVLRSFGQGQTSISTTVPGITRGEHFHFTKIERFVVVAGEATISMRRLLTDEVTTYRVSGTEPVAIDMPPLTTHNIVNVGSNELVTLFWSNDHFDPDNPDTYGEPVMIPGAIETVR